MREAFIIIIYVRLDHGLCCCLLLHGWGGGDIFLFAESCTKERSKNTKTPKTCLFAGELRLSHEEMCRFSEWAPL
jgi:predicted esterase